MTTHTTGSPLFKRKPFGNALNGVEPANDAAPVNDDKPANVSGPTAGETLAVGPEAVTRKVANREKGPTNAGAEASVSPPLNGLAGGGFDFEALRLSQDYTQFAGAEKLLTTVPVRKPNKHEFVRVHPGMRFEALFLDLKEGQESYLVESHLLTDVYGIAVPVSLRLAVNRAGVFFMWPVRLPGDDGRSNRWHESAWEAVDLAVKRWVSVRANMNLGAYELILGAENLSEPEWPNKSLGELAAIAFRNRIIKDIDHPVIQRLQGLV